MKLLAVFFLFVALCKGHAIPLIPGDNSHYIEGESRYIWMPNHEGIPVLVDLHESVNWETISATRDGANNQYWLFTRENPTSRQVLVNGNISSIQNSNYQSNRPTKVISHGWNGDGGSEMNIQITSAFLAQSDCNVIVLDWSDLANSLYVSAAAGVPDVGRQLGNFIEFLFNTTGGNWNQLHLVGFSLGAHVVGNAGRQIGGKADRVTGLDPAGPGFHLNSHALNRDAAQYVEAIHTDGRLLGLMTPIGHADFYPNGGRFPQPGCLTSICGHGRSTELFASSVRTNHFNGKQCANRIEAEFDICNSEGRLVMGNAVLNKRGNGIFGLSTTSEWPF